MKAQLIKLSVLALAGSMAACTGQIGGPGVGTSGSGAHTGGPGGGSSSGSGGTGVSGSGGTGVSGPGGAGVSGSLDLTGSPSYFRFVRLTNAQWARSVQDILALPTPSGLENDFQSAVSGTTDFQNNELVLDVSERAWSDYRGAAESLATQVTASDATLAKVYTGTDAAGFISAFGRRAYRRPLTTAEKSTYMTLFSSGATLTGARSAFAKGASLVVRAMLQSPYFLYRSVLGANGTPLSGYEMAAKLSLLLRNTTPNDALLDSAAGPGKLDAVDGAVALATTMLGEPTATAVMREVHGGLLHFDRYENISKVGVPAYKTSLNAEYQESSYLFFDNVFTKGLGLKEILTSTSGFVGPGMAALYEGGIAAPASGFVERNLGPNRVGYFSQLPFLTLYGTNAEPDSIHRGVSLNLDVLCTQLGPPATVIPMVPPIKAGQTNRQRISDLTAGCGGTCHNAQINPLGFAFEHFDGMGQYRATEKNGTADLTIDASGSFGFSDGVKTFNDAAGLMQVIAQTPQAHQCYAKKLSSFVLQRDVVVADMPMLTSLGSVSLSAGGSTKQVLLEVIKNNAFRTRVGGAQ